MADPIFKKETLQIYNNSQLLETLKAVNDSMNQRLEK